MVSINYFDADRRSFKREITDFKVQAVTKLLVEGFLPIDEDNYKQPYTGWVAEIISLPITELK